VNGFDYAVHGLGVAFISLIANCDDLTDKWWLYFRMDWSYLPLWQSI